MNHSYFRQVVYQAETLSVYSIYFVSVSIAQYRAVKFNFLIFLKIRFYNTANLKCIVSFCTDIENIFTSL